MYVRHLVILTCGATYSLQGEYFCCNDKEIIFGVMDEFVNAGNMFFMPEVTNEHFDHEFFELGHPEVSSKDVQVAWIQLGLQCVDSSCAV